MLARITRASASGWVNCGQRHQAGRPTRLVDLGQLPCSRFALVDPLGVHRARELAGDDRERVRRSDARRRAAAGRWRHAWVTGSRARASSHARRRRGRRPSRRRRTTSPEGVPRRPRPASRLHLRRRRRGVGEPTAGGVADQNHVTLDGIDRPDDRVDVVLQRDVGAVGLLGLHAGQREGMARGVPLVRGMGRPGPTTMHRARAPGSR